MESDQGKENIITKSPKSPNILKPKPLCFRKKPRRLVSSQPLSTLDANVSNSAPKQIFLTKSTEPYFNPFKCSAVNKRKRDYDVKENTENSILLHLTPNGTPELQDQVDDPISALTPAFINENANQGFNRNHFLCDSKQTKKELFKAEKQLPVDWSLKTKIRLTSEKPFPWRTNFKTSEEASGTTGFVRCLHSDEQNNPTCGLDSSYGAKFYQQCLVWIHPSIPWMTLFPRVDNRVSSNSSILPLDSHQQEILHSNWCDSFRSLYQLVRTCQCPFFYMCTSAFTVMFRAGGVGSVLNIHAAITPTTRGLRKALKEEGIEFTMPLRPSSDNDVGDEDEKSCLNEESNLNMDVDMENVNDNGEDPENGLNEEEEPGIWLESLGLSQQDFPSLNPNRSKLKKESRKSVDHRPESLVYVEDSETQALINFLLNYPSCTSKIGPMAGVPPTLLSPVAFLGSTLQAHKIHHNKICTGGQQLFTVELTGPLLPNAVHSLCSLFSSTQDGDFTAHLTSYAPTTAFTKLRPQRSSVPSAFATENLKDCGLPKPFITQMCSNNTSSLGGMNNIVAKQNLFSWT